MTRFALTLEYDGAPFFGLQRQSHQPSVQQAVEEAVFAITGETANMVAAARSFLQHQVRSMVGCLGLVGLGRWREEQIAQVLEARDRTQLGLNAPACGLYFVKADYPGEE